MHYISLLNKDVSHVVDCMQYDTERNVSFLVEEDLSNKYIFYELETANDKEVSGKCSLSEDNVVSFLIPENCTAKPDVYKGQIIVKESEDSSDRLGSFPFYVNVEEAPHQSDDPYEVALSEVRQATKEAQEATKDLEQLKSTLQESISNANAATEAANNAASQWQQLKPTIDEKMQQMDSIIERFGDVNPDELVTPEDLQSAIDNLQSSITNSLNDMKNGNTDVMVETEGA